MKVLIFVTMLFLIVQSNAAEPAAKRHVDIGDMVAMAQLSKSDPETFDKVRRLLAGIGQQPARDAEKWAKVNFGAEALENPGMLMTSDPSKHRISFVLGDTRFAGIYKLGQWEQASSPK